jgi:hypothetical protein
MPYSESLSTQKPGCILILIDQSGSMSERFGGSGGGSKAEECAKAVNRVLREMGLSCTAGSAIKDRCEVSVIGYGASGSDAYVALAGPLHNQSIVTMTDLLNNCLRVDTVKVKIPDGAGGLVEVDDQIPIWVDPVAAGTTPMAAAFDAAHKVIQDWTQRHPDSFPPVIVNITDGAPDDRNATQKVVGKLMQTGTNDGLTLILNAHISSNSAAKMGLPAAEEQLPQSDSYAKFLFDISSELPGIMIERASASGFSPKAGSRGFIYNADAEMMIRFLEFGTRANYNQE